jgi:hypothetical protein
MQEWMVIRYAAMDETEESKAFRQTLISLLSSAILFTRALSVRDFEQVTSAFFGLLTLNACLEPTLGTQSVCQQENLEWFL